MKMRNAYIVFNGVNSVLSVWTSKAHAIAAGKRHLNITPADWHHYVETSFTITIQTADDRIDIDIRPLNQDG
jgi:hypothetical protein